MIATHIHSELTSHSKFKKWKPCGPKPYTRNQSIYLSPFANESRCLGLLESIKKNGTWAVVCHGWMLLSGSQFEQINNMVDVSCCTCWVIVKEYLPEPTNRSHIATIVDNFRIPKDARILPGDMSPKNFRGSQAVDLGAVLTEPHPAWSEFGFRWFFTKTLLGIASWEDDDQVPDTSPDIVASLSSRVDTSGRFSVSFYLCLYAFLLSSSIVYLGRNLGQRPWAC